MEKEPLNQLPSPEERRKLRKTMGLTVIEAAQEIGVTPRTIQRWEHGKTTAPKPENHRKYQTAIQRWQETIQNHR